ncbi:hypothetical protein HK096_009982, partial [Nowakowskiella sp. JEL0078]
MNSDCQSIGSSTASESKIMEIQIPLVPSITTLAANQPELPASQRVNLSWFNLNKTIDQEVPDNGGLDGKKKKFSIGGRKKKTSKKQILFDISGQANPGEVIAIMGPSGSGKTTLLSVLGGRGAHEGLVTFNGQKLNKAMKRQTAFVLQEDNFFDLTVRQQLLFTAQLRLPEKLTYKEKCDRVDDVMSSLGLTGCADS